MEELRATRTRSKSEWSSVADKLPERLVTSTCNDEKLGVEKWLLHEGACN